MSGRYAPRIRPKGEGMESSGFEFIALEASGRLERKGETCAPPLPYGRRASARVALQRSPILWPGKEDDIRQRTVNATSGESCRERGSLPLPLTKLIMDVPRFNFKG
jgi:hypothetical protein